MRLSILGLCAVALFLGSVCSVGAAEANSTGEEALFSALDQDKLRKMIAEWDKSEAKAGERKRKYEKRPVSRFFLDNLELKAALGYTDIAGTKRGSGSPVSLDKEEAYSVEVGWFDKPAFDFLLLGDKSYKEHKGKTGKTDLCSKESWLSFFDDELKFDLGLGFGRTIIKKDNGSSLEATSKTYFNVGLHYSVPLEQLFFNSEY